jgi:O-antigen ligase
MIETPRSSLTPSQPIAPPPASLVTTLPFLAAAVIGVVVPFEPRLAVLVLVFIAFLARRLSTYEALLHVLLASVFVESVTVGPLRVGRVLAIVAVAVIVFRIVVTRWRPPRLRPITWVPAALFVAWAWASGFWARDHADWSFAMFQLALAVCFCAAFALFVESAEQVRRLLRTFVVAATLAGALGFVQAFVSAKGRATGLQGDANIYAMYQVAAIAAAVGLIRTSPPQQRRLWRLAVVVLLVSVAASLSRGGLLALAFVVLWAFGRRLLTPSGALTAAVLVALGAGILLSVPAISHRVSPSQVEKDRASGRIDIWFVAWRSVTRHPVLGLGAGNFKSHSIELLEREPGVELVKSHLLLLPEGIETHNVYLETLAEYGVPGCLLFVSILGFTAWNLHPRRRGRRGPVRRMAVVTAVPAALTGMLLAFASGAVFLSIVNNKLLWALVGVAAARHARRRAPEPPASLPVSLPAR